MSQGSARKLAYHVMAANQPKYDVFVVKYDVFVVKDGKDGKDGWWTKIGAAFEAKNDTVVIELHAHPIGSRLILRPFKPPREDEKPPQS